MSIFILTSTCQIPESRWQHLSFCSSFCFFLGEGFWVVRIWSTIHTVLGISRCGCEFWTTKFISRHQHNTTTHLPSCENFTMKHPFLATGSVSARELGTLHSWPARRPHGAGPFRRPDSPLQCNKIFPPLLWIAPMCTLQASPVRSQRLIRGHKHIVV